MDKNIHIEFSIYQNGYKLYIGRREGEKRYVGELIFKEFTAGEYVDPTYIMDETEAKSVASQLARLGFVQSDDAGELAATKRHLQDMRYLAKVTNEKPNV